jgi:hypothetical protein
MDKVKIRNPWNADYGCYGSKQFFFLNRKSFESTAKNSAGVAFTYELRVEK